MEDSAEAYDSLPSLVLTLIFIKLPLESILACRIVCKSWYNVILESFFAKQQHAATPRCLLTTNSMEFGFTRFGHIDLSHCRNRSGSGFTGYSLEEAGYQIQSPDYRLFLIGSCNGLACLGERVFSETMKKYHFKVVLFNPMVGNLLILPDPPEVQGGLGGLQHFGFGYVPSTGQYKVVKISYGFVSNSRRSRRRQPIFHVCTIQYGHASSWTTIVDDVEGTIEEPCLASDIREGPAFLKGSLIWTSDKCLIHFDIDEERSQTHGLPSGMFQAAANTTTIGVGVYYDDNDGDNHLYIKEFEFDPLCTRIWVMEKWKSIDSFKLKWVFQTPGCFRIPVSMLRVLRDGSVLTWVHGQDLALFHPETGDFKTIELAGKLFVEMVLDRPSLLGCMLPHQIN